MAQRLIISTINCDEETSSLFVDFAKEKGFKVLKEDNEIDEDDDSLSIIYLSKEL